MNIFDIVIIVIVSFCLIRGIFNGLVGEVSGIIGVYAGFYGAYKPWFCLSGFIWLSKKLLDYLMIKPV